MTRIKDPSVIEARLLELAHTTDAKITAPALAYFAPCSIEDAASVLEALAAHDRVSMDVEDDGSIVYTMPGRQKLAGHAPNAPHAPRRAARLPAHALPSPSPLLAVVLSGFLPGAGHLYAGRLGAGALWFAAVGIGYALVLPGLLLHLWCMVSAAAAARRVGQRSMPLLVAA
ncbi:MAG: hypothetical protein WKG01_23985 [Kofleriaceae bacterium]